MSPNDGNLDEIHRRFGDWVRGYFRRHFQKDWEDLSQEVFLRLGQHLSGQEKRGDEVVRAFISRTVRSVAVDAIRRRARRPGGGVAGEEVADDRTGGDERVAVTDDLRAVRTAAQSRLDARQRAILKLRFEDGLSFREIAQVLGVPQGSVAGWYSRALDLLREALP